MAFQDNYYHTSISAHFWKPPTQCRIIFSWVLITSKGGDDTTSLSNLFQYLFTRTPFLLWLTGIFFNLCPFTLVMSLGVSEKNLALCPFLLPIRTLLTFFLYLFQLALHRYCGVFEKHSKVSCFIAKLGFLCVACVCMWVVVFISHAHCSCFSVKVTWGQKINSETAL